MSSPVRAGSSRNIKKFALDARNGGKALSAVESEDDDDYFEPIREGASIAVHKARQLEARQLGPPIQEDERMKDLSEKQRDIVNIFVPEAKQLFKGIQLKKDLRAQPFSDTILREIAIRVPTNQRELLRVPGINAEMAKIYGSEVFTLLDRIIQYSEHGLLAVISPKAKPRGSRRKQIVDEDDADNTSAAENSEVPQDPNHRIVEFVDLTFSDQEEVKKEVVEASEDESDYGSSLDGDELTQTSRYFPSAMDEYSNKQVEEYNRQASHLGAMRMSAPPTKASSSARGGTGYKGKSGGGKSSRKSWKNDSSGGVSKKPYKARSRNGSGSFSGATKRSRGGANRRGGGGGASAATSGIMMMPT